METKGVRILNATIGVMIILALIGLLCLFIHFAAVGDGSKQDNMETTVDSCAQDSFTVKDFVLELHIQKIKYPDIVLRQGVLESSYFSSTIFKTYNNPFGFYYKNNYLKFNSYKDAIDYYKKWQTKWYRDGEEYYDFLERIGYARDSLYTKKLRNIDLSKLK